MKVSENQKQFYLFNIPITTIPKIDTTTNELFLLSVKKCFKIAGKTSVAESIFSKVTGEILY